MITTRSRSSISSSRVLRSRKKKEKSRSRSNSPAIFSPAKDPTPVVVAALSVKKSYKKRQVAAASRKILKSSVSMNPPVQNETPGEDKLETGTSEDTKNLNQMSLKVKIPIVEKPREILKPKHRNPIKDLEERIAQAEKSRSYIIVKDPLAGEGPKKSILKKSEPEKTQSQTLSTAPIFLNSQNSDKNHEKVVDTSSKTTGSQSQKSILKKAYVPPLSSQVETSVLKNNLADKTDPDSNSDETQFIESDNLNNGNVDDELVRIFSDEPDETNIDATKEKTFVESSTKKLNFENKSTINTVGLGDDDAVQEETLARSKNTKIFEISSNVKVIKVIETQDISGNPVKVALARRPAVSHNDEQISNDSDKPNTKIISTRNEISVSIRPITSNDDFSQNPLNLQHLDIKPLNHQKKIIHSSTISKSKDESDVQLQPTSNHIQVIKTFKVSEFLNKNKAQLDKTFRVSDNLPDSFNFGKNAQISKNMTDSSSMLDKTVKNSEKNTNSSQLVKSPLISDETSKLDKSVPNPPKTYENSSNTTTTDSSTKLDKTTAKNSENCTDSSSKLVKSIKNLEKELNCESQSSSMLDKTAQNSEKVSESDLESQSSKLDKSAQNSEKTSESQAKSSKLDKTFQNFEKTSESQSQSSSKHVKSSQNSAKHHETSSKKFEKSPQSLFNNDPLFISYKNSLKRHPAPPLSKTQDESEQLNKRQKIEQRLTRGSKRRALIGSPENSSHLNDGLFTNGLPKVIRRPNVILQPEEVSIDGPVYEDGFVWEEKVKPEVAKSSGRSILKRRVDEVEATPDKGHEKDEKKNGQNYGNGDENELVSDADDRRNKSIDDCSTPMRKKSRTITFSSEQNHVRFYHSPSLLRKKQRNKRFAFEPRTILPVEDKTPEPPPIEKDVLMSDMNSESYLKSNETHTSQTINHLTQQITSNFKINTDFGANLDSPLVVFEGNSSKNEENLGKNEEILENLEKNEEILGLNSEILDGNGEVGDKDEKMEEGDKGITEQSLNESNFEMSELSELTTQDYIFNNSEDGNYRKEPLFPQLENCGECLSEIAHLLTSSSTKEALLSMFHVYGITTIGELSMKTEIQLKNFPILSPKYETTQKALSEYYNSVFLKNPGNNLDPLLSSAEKSPVPSSPNSTPGSSDDSCRVIFSQIPNNNEEFSKCSQSLDLSSSNLVNFIIDELHSASLSSSEFLDRVLSHEGVFSRILRNMLKRGDFMECYWREASGNFSDLAKSPISLADFIMSEEVKKKYGTLYGISLPDSLPQFFWKSTLESLQDSFIHSQRPPVFKSKKYFSPTFEESPKHQSLSIEDFERKQISTISDFIQKFIRQNPSFSPNSSLILPNDENSEKNTSNMAKSKNIEKTSENKEENSNIINVPVENNLEKNAPNTTASLNTEKIGENMEISSNIEAVPVENIDFQKTSEQETFLKGALENFGKLDEESVGKFLMEIYKIRQ